MPDFSAFILRLEKQRRQKAEKDGGGDTGGCGPKAAEQCAEQPLAVHGLAHALGEIIAEAGQRDGRTRTAEIHEILIDAHAAENNARNDVGGQDARRGEFGRVDEQLADEAE